MVHYNPHPSPVNRGDHGVVFGELGLQHAPIPALVLRTADFVFYHLLLSLVDRVSHLPRDAG